MTSRRRVSAKCPSGMWAWLWVWGMVATLATATAAQADDDQGGGRVEVQPPVTVAVTVLGEHQARRVVGDLVAFDRQTLTLDQRGRQMTLRWEDLTSQSAFTARYRIVDQDDARSWLELGAFGRAVGAEQQAERALRQALRLDPDLEAEVAWIRLQPPGTLRRQPAPPPDSQDPGAGGPFGDHPPGELLHAAPPATVTHYLPVTQQEHERAIRRYRRAAHADAQMLGVSLREIETEHFLIFTDWEPVDDEWLRNQLQEAYRLVAREFDVPYEQNIFVGKLPVYMFDSHADFLRYAHDIDGHTQFGSTVAGYYWGRTDGMGKLVMSKPQETQRIGLQQARRVWARVLTHEMVHAFMARYKSNAYVPRWLNEGFAEMIAEKVLPRPGAMETAARVARRQQSIRSIFDERVLPSAEMYPVMMTLVEALYSEDPRRFALLVERIKAGENPEEALKGAYGVDYAGLEQAWRAWVVRQVPSR